MCYFKMIRDWLWREDIKNSKFSTFLHARISVFAFEYTVRNWTLWNHWKLMKFRIIAVIIRWKNKCCFLFNYIKISESIFLLERQVRQLWHPNMCLSLFAGAIWPLKNGRKIFFWNVLRQRVAASGTGGCSLSC